MGLSGQDMPGGGVNVSRINADATCRVSEACFESIGLHGGSRNAIGIKFVFIINI